jgi:hypothetical protein
MGDFQHEAWEKAQRRFPLRSTNQPVSWIAEGLVVLDLDGTEIGRHLGPEVSSFPLWGERRPVGLTEDGLCIPYEVSVMEGEEPSLPSLFIPWNRLQAGYDAFHFNVVADVVTTLRLTGAAAEAVRSHLEASHA